MEIKYTKFFLENGIKCVLYNREEIHSVSVKVSVNVGALDENEEENGLSHFLEHLAAGDGSVDLPTWEDFDKYKNEYSGKTNAYTSYDHTQYYGTFPSQYVENAIYFFSQQVLHPLLKESDIEKERSIILDEKRRADDDINRLYFDQARNTRFEGANTAFHRDILGIKNNLETFSRKDINTFYKKHYTPSNIEIFIVGNIDIDKVKEFLEKYFYREIKYVDFEESNEKKYRKDVPEYTNFKIATKQKQDIDQYYLTLTFPTDALTEVKATERFKHSFLSDMTATPQFSKSVLWKRLREELNLVYGVNYYTNSYLVARNFVEIVTSFNGEKLEVVLKEIYEGLNRIKIGEIDEDVFKAKQKRILDTQMMQLDKPENVLDWIIDYEDELKEHGEGIKLEDYLEYIQSTKFEDIIEFSRKTFDWSRVNIGVVSRDDSSDVKNKILDIWTKIVSKDQQITLI